VALSILGRRAKTLLAHSRGRFALFKLPATPQQAVGLRFAKPVSVRGPRRCSIRQGRAHRRFPPGCGAAPRPLGGATCPGAELHRGRWGALPARVRSCTAAAGGRFLPGCGAAPRPLGGATCPGAELHVSSPPPGAGWRAACTKAVLADDALKQCQASQSHRRGRGCGCPLCQHTSSEVLRTTEIGCISPVLQVTAGRVVSDRHGCTLETLSRFQAPPYSAKVTPYSLPVSHRVDIAWSKEDTQKRVHCLRTRTYAEKPGLCIRNRNEITKRKKSLQI
jgi:hypothetical protein